MLVAKVVREKYHINLQPTECYIKTVCTLGNCFCNAENQICVHFDLGNKRVSDDFQTIATKGVFKITVYNAPKEH